MKASLTDIILKKAAAQPLASAALTSANVESMATPVISASQSDASNGESIPAIAIANRESMAQAASAPVYASTPRSEEKILGLFELAAQR